MSKGAAITTIVIVAIIVIVYLIIIFETFKKQTWIFKPIQDDPPTAACFPLIAVQPLSDSDRINLQNNIKSAELPDPKENNQ